MSSNEVIAAQEVAPEEVGVDTEIVKENAFVPVVEILAPANENDEDENQADEDGENEDDEEDIDEDVEENENIDEEGEENVEEDRDISNQSNEDNSEGENVIELNEKTRKREAEPEDAVVHKSPSQKKKRAEEEQTENEAIVT